MNQTLFIWLHKNIFQPSSTNISTGAIIPVVEDSYAQDLMTFYTQAMLHDEVEAFLSVLQKADEQGKYLMHVSPFDTLVLYDDYFVRDLVLTDKLP